jgi:transcriptional regulator with XRE-family HTH domain
MGNAPTRKKRTPLARALIKARAANGWTQRDLAKAAGVSHVTVANIERGHHGGLYSTTIYKLGEALGVGGDALYDLYEESTEEEEQ